MVGGIHVLVNNAGLERLTPLDEITDEAEAVFRRVWRSTCGHVSRDALGGAVDAPTAERS